MSKEQNLQPSEAELEILQALWELEPTTVRAIHDLLSKKKEVGYTTTLKQMQRMFEKGMITRNEEGRPHLYSTILKEKKVKQSLLDRLLHSAFKGSAIELIQHALGRAEVGNEEIEELEKLIQQKKQQQKDDQ